MSEATKIVLGTTIVTLLVGGWLALALLLG